MKKYNGITASHTSGTDMGTDWRDNDPDVEPIVEIYQGMRQNYEIPDGPRANTSKDSIDGWRPKGFVSDALERGYKLGFQASSDHISTHQSYANVLVTSNTREALMDAIRKRHIYASTDNIVADVRSGSHLMGDVFTTDTPPDFSVKRIGTSPFTKVVIVKDNQTSTPRRPAPSRWIFAGVITLPSPASEVIIRSRRTAEWRNRLGIALLDHLHRKTSGLQFQVRQHRDYEAFWEIGFLIRITERSRMRSSCGRILITASTGKAGHQLLDHQCWVLRRDVLSTAGNMLCEFGFHQVRCPNGGLTQYELRNALGEDTHVYLWGFGTFFGNEEEGIFLGRSDFKPRRTLGKVDLHRKEDPHFRDETSRLDLFLRGIAWFAEYEQWIARRMPEGYRELCLATFPRKAPPGGEFARRWRVLADYIEEDQHKWDG